MNGNTVYVFTLMKAERQYMEYDDEVYDAVFVARPEPTDGTLSALTLQLIGLKEKQEVLVHVDFEEEIPVAASVTAKRQVRVTEIERVSANRRGRRSL